MDNILDRIIIEPFERFVDRLVQFLPDVLMAVLIFVFGIILAAILRSILSRVFQAIRLDKFTERFGMIDMLKKGGVQEPFSVILSKLIGWIIIISFSIMSLRSLDIPEMEQIFEKFFLYLPNIFVAGIILFLGYLLSNFLSRAALIASVNAGIKLSGLIARFVKISIFLLASTMALEQLGIGKETIIITFAIIFGGIVLALAIAFGFGGRDIAKEYLEKKIHGEGKKDDISHL